MDSEEKLPRKRKCPDESSTSDTDDPNTDDHPQSISTKKIKSKKNVRFDDVTVYYFARSQSFVSVPSQGTITLGMVPEHSHVEQYSVAEFSRLRHALHKSILRERKILPPSSSSTLDSDTDEDESLPVDDYYFIQPIATRQRRTLLKEAGLLKIDPTEKHELALIRRSREVCGCSCTREAGGCQPSTCECYLNGIACQVDRLTFPCPCATMLCKNPLGRLEFNQNRVRNHFFQTITRLKAEKEQEEIVSLIDQQSRADDQLIVASVLSIIISTIELEEREISSLLHSLVSSVDDSLLISVSSPISFTTSIEMKNSTSKATSPTEDAMRVQRVCHSNPLSIQHMPTASIPSTTMISAESS